MSHIRKLSIGPDYKYSMHYVIGQKILGGTHIIHLIQEVDDSYKIWIEKDKEIYLWKQLLKTLPISLEFNINF